MHKATKSLKMQDENQKMRINKYLASAGLCSRREADKIISAQRVTINGVVATLGDEVGDGDAVVFDGHLVELGSKHHYYKLNKPVGIECTSNQEVKENIISFVGLAHRVFTIGRLDKNSHGLILLTDDGDLANRLIKSRYEHEKEYVVRVDKPVTTEFLKGMSGGVPILDTVTKKCKVEKKSRFEFNIILTQGLNRQIRRMCEYFGYRVLSLKRIRVGTITLDGLKDGELKALSSSELKSLKALLSDEKD